MKHGCCQCIEDIYITILELDEAMVAAHVELPVLEHDELPALLALLCSTPAVALVLSQATLIVETFGIRFFGIWDLKVGIRNSGLRDFKHQI